MNVALFMPISKLIAARRPQWKIGIEDTLLRLSTQQFAVEWDIVDEMINSGDFVMEEVIMHQALGIVLCIRYTGGT